MIFGGAQRESEWSIFFCSRFVRLVTRSLSEWVPKLSNGDHSRNNCISLIYYYYQITLWWVLILGHLGSFCSSAVDLQFSFSNFWFWIRIFPIRTLSIRTLSIRTLPIRTLCLLELYLLELCLLEFCLLEFWTLELLLLELWTFRSNF